MVSKIIGKFKSKRALLATLVSFTLVVILTIVIVNHSFGFKVSNNESSTDTFPENYYLSSSNCVDFEGKVISDVVDYDGENITVEPGKTAQCKLEFEVPNSNMITYDSSKSHAKGDSGEECTTIDCALDRLYGLYK